MAVTIRANDVKASNLYFLSIALGGLTMLIFPSTSAYKSSPLVPNSFILVFSLLLIGALGWGVRQGKRWVKVLYVGYIALGLFLYFKWLLLQHNPIGKTILYLLSSALQAWSAVILLKDLLRKPEAPDAGVAGGGYNRPN